MTKIPEPKYDYQVDRLVKMYKRAVRDIYRTLDRIDISNMTRALSAAALKEVAEVLSSLNEESAAWVAENIPVAVQNGALTTLVALDVKDAEKITSFSRLNRELIEAVVADTQSDLLAVTQNIDRKVRTTIRQVTAESMRANMTRGVNGRKTMNRTILEGLQRS